MTELFDWIVGTSTGGVLALGIVYGMFWNDGRVGPSIVNPLN